MPPFFIFFTGHLSLFSSSSTSLFDKGLLSFIISLTKKDARKNRRTDLLLDNLVYISTLLGTTALCNTDILMNRGLLSTAH